jgi:hypothetical protein
VALPDDCPVCHADLAYLNVPGPEGRPERIDCMGRQQHSWLVVNQGKPERPDYFLGEQLTPGPFRPGRRPRIFRWVLPSHRKAPHGAHYFGMAPGSGPRRVPTEGKDSRG